MAYKASDDKRVKGRHGPSNGSPGKGPKPKAEAHITTEAYERVMGSYLPKKQKEQEDKEFWDRVLAEIAKASQ
jgi:hypothetical protein